MNLVFTIALCIVLAGLSVAAVKHGGRHIVGAIALTNVIPAAGAIYTGFLAAGALLGQSARYPLDLPGPLMAVCIAAVAAWPIVVAWAVNRRYPGHAAPTSHQPPPAQPATGPTYVPNSRTRTYNSAHGASPRWKPHTRRP